MASISIPDEPLEAWLAELKPYQRETLNEFLVALDPEEAAKCWLTTIGNQNIAAFGGSGERGNSAPFWERFKAECRRFLCDDTAYEEDKKSLAKEIPVSKPVLISVMSGAIGAHLGAAGTLVAPAVTVVLFTIGRLGLNAYCARDAGA